MTGPLTPRIDPGRGHEIDHHFAAVADAYDRLAFAGPGHTFVSGRELSVVREALRSVPSGSSVLDVGVGTGRVSRFLAADPRLRVTGIDRAEGMLRAARSAVPTVALLRACANELPFADRRFDAIVGLRVLKWVPRWADAVGEMARVLRPGGTVILEMTNRHSVSAFGYRGAPVTLITRRELHLAVEMAGLTVIGWWPGVRLPHAAWALASTPRRARAVGRVERALDPLLGVLGARSVIAVAQKPSTESS